MNKYTKKIPKAPVSYVTQDGVIMKRTLTGIKGVHIPNSFDIPTVRAIVGTFNGMISRFMYHAYYDKYGNERNRPISQDHIYLPSSHVSDMVNRSDSQARNIINDLKRIFDLNVTRSSANRFRLSQRVDEFLFIFTLPKLYAFMEKYNITDSTDRKRLLLLFHYRAVRPSDKNMEPEHWRDYKTFMSDRKHSNYNHECHSHNQSYDSRIQKIELNINLLSDKQKEQLLKIKSLLKEGITRLVHRFHRKLIELQQYVTMMLLKDQVTSSKSNQTEVIPQSQVIDRNKTTGEMQKTHEVAANHLKDPEDVPFQLVVQIGTYWNIMARDREIEFMFSLTDKKIQSIVTLVKSHGKEKILDTIKNTGNLNINSLLKFKSFMKDSSEPDSRFNKIFRFKNPHSSITEDEQLEMRNRTFKFWTNHSPVAHDNIPVFNSKAEAKSWFKSNTHNM